MTGALFVLWNDDMRRRAHEAIDEAPKETRVEIKGPRRTLDQNAKMHAMIGDIAKQHQHAGRTLSVKQWKVLLMVALGLEQVEWIPSLDDDGDPVPVGTSTGELSIAQCSDMIELLYAKGATWGVIWTEPERWRHAPPPREAAE